MRTGDVRSLRLGQFLSQRGHIVYVTDCGAKGTRTPNPLLAKQVRYQLRHSPVRLSPRHTMLRPAAASAQNHLNGHSLSQSPHDPTCSNWRRARTGMAADLPHDPDERDDSEAQALDEGDPV